MKQGARALLRFPGKEKYEKNGRSSSFHFRPLQKWYDPSVPGRESIKRILNSFE